LHFVVVWKAFFGRAKNLTRMAFGWKTWKNSENEAWEPSPTPKYHSGLVTGTTTLFNFYGSNGP